MHPDAQLIVGEQVPGTCYLPNVRFRALARAQVVGLHRERLLIDFLRKFRRRYRRGRSGVGDSWWRRVAMRAERIDATILRRDRANEHIAVRFCSCPRQRRNRSCSTSNP